MTNKIQRLVLVTRADLIPGYQSVQPAHTLADFSQKFSRIFQRWHRLDKNLVILTVRNEKELTVLASQAEERGIHYSLFREPDIGNEATALALEPSEGTYSLTGSLPLALKHHNTG